ncbi:MAG: response regulator [Magnetococcales bacterium]|nr:response regulator [Magnetococcales bacterium]
MQSKSTKIKLMIVDDEPEIQRSIGRFISFQPEMESVEIINASTFEEALKLLENETPLIILQDINLPDGNGLQFIKQAKKKYPMVQFIVITGASDLDRVMEAISLGAVDYIKKPLDLESLSTVIQETMNRCKRLRELLVEEYSSQNTA